MRSVALLLLISAAAACQSPLQHTWFVSVESEPVAAGTLWLYSFSWYGLLQTKLADITQGVAVVDLNPERWKREHDPHPNTDAFAIVADLGQNRWYRTADIPPEKIWAGLKEHIESLGVVSADANLRLPALARRRIVLQYMDGRPAANATVQLAVYVSDRNHCAAHQGLPLGTFRSDANGVLEIEAPPVDLYLSFLQPAYKEEPTGVWTSLHGLKIGRENPAAVRLHWQLRPEDDSSRLCRIRVLDRAGKPRRGVTVVHFWNTSSCGGHDEAARTSRSGIAELWLVRPNTSGLSLKYGDAEPYDLTRRELETLFDTGSLTIRWTPQSPHASQ